MSRNPTNPSPFGNANCMEMLQIVLDGQATEEQLKYWKAHTGICHPCYEKYKLDTAVIEKIKSECCCSKVPQDVIEQLSKKIKEIA